jgi:hexosaminidase
MKSVLHFLFLFIIVQPLIAQTKIKLPVLPDSIFGTYYQQRHSVFRQLHHTRGDIIFIGNSITDGCELNDLFNDKQIKNRGISGDITAGVINRLYEVAARKPSKVFLLIGTNDLARGISADSVANNILLITNYLKQESPNTKLFVQSILPVNNVFGKFQHHTNKTDVIIKANHMIHKLANSNGFTFINLYPYFTNEHGLLDIKYTNDGLHLLGEGYCLWKHIIFPYIYDVEEKPALIPLPQQLIWLHGIFSLNQCKTIVAAKHSLNIEATLLRNLFIEHGWQPDIKDKALSDETHIELTLDSAYAPSVTNEGYVLKVTEKKILIAAKTTTGIFYGIQTLRQLMRNGVSVDACQINDQPAFTWRGFMIDAGRNYLSMELLKKQIDVMSMYKLNVFHFHATEDIAWRIASKQYPQLTAPEYMLRNKGMYYTQNEIKELIAYCNKKHITFVPEIDMPGHSAAFKRAMKTDMQTDTGTIYVKNILKEFCETFNVPYIHIGADEVKISNINFVPEITAFIESLGKKVIGWQPGGNYTENTIRQLWMDDNAHHSSSKKIQSIDSRHLYLNHMDPLEAVTSIYNRRIGDKEKGDTTTLGGTICMWHDRAVANENDIMIMNPVYAAMLTFAERSWRGGGQSGWIANIDDGDKNGFIDFENRLIAHKNLYFNNKPFNYQRQSNTIWKLYGPYVNHGDLKKQFLPESKNWIETNTHTYKQLTGGTIVLRHWWAPLIKGAIENAEDSTTWYATTKIWAHEEGEKYFWIGFNNISRSPATNSPPAYAWDNKSSAVWLNGNLVEPPIWKRPGQKGNSEIPLIDEGYEYRTPTKLLLQKGWNSILIKAPIGSFNSNDWQNPVKWMFTLVLDEDGDS